MWPRIIEKLSWRVSLLLIMIQKWQIAPDPIWRRSCRHNICIAPFSCELISKVLRITRVNEGSHSFYLSPTRLTTNGMSHSAFNLQAAALMTATLLWFYVWFYVVQSAGRIISSSVWRMSVLTFLDRLCGTTPCVVITPAKYRWERQSRCGAMTTNRRSDTSLFSVTQQMKPSTSVRSKCWWEVYRAHMRSY